MFLNILTVVLLINRRRGNNMGVHSTLEITREKALELWYSKEPEVDLTNEFLESWLDGELHERFYNVCIVQEEDIGDLSSGMWLSLD